MMMTTTEHACQCGLVESASQACAWSGPRDQMVEIEYVPMHLRGSRIDAVASVGGELMDAGTERALCEGTCAQRLQSADPDWVRICE